MKHPNKKMSITIATKLPEREAELFKQIAYEHELNVTDALRLLARAYIEHNGKGPFETKDTV